VLELARDIIEKLPLNYNMEAVRPFSAGAQTSLSPYSCYEWRATMTKDSSINTCA